MHRLKVKPSGRTLIAIFAVVVIFWNEYLALKISSLSWLPPSENPNAFPILIVSDPQIIGYRNEPAGIGPLSRWDADRYLARGFAQAVAVAKPKAIIFLGDLFDEGVQMNNQEFEYTIERFKAIFPEIRNVLTFYIPGDNDIGGEYEPVYDRLVNRFARRFDHTSAALKASKSFMKFASIDSLANNEVSVLSSPDNAKVKILMSHIPLVRVVGRKLNEELTKYDPDLVLSAHDHTAEIYLRDRLSTQFKRFALHRSIEFIISPTHPTIEIQSPTVSYRMGVQNMGYGVLTLSDESPAVVQYTIYWLPGRYPQLCLYIFALIVISYYFLRRYFVFNFKSKPRTRNSFLPLKKGKNIQ
uniref:Metallophos domain-containing protein n=1 Tax=Panagrellus redivivus TaxID=6233 RepID=A0A7E4UZM6_PANRE